MKSDIDYRRLLQQLRKRLEAERFGNLTEAEKALYTALLAVEREHLWPGLESAA